MVSKYTYVVCSQPKTSCRVKTSTEAAHIFAEKLFATSKKMKIKFTIKNTSNGKIFRYIATRYMKGGVGSPQMKITDLPEDLTIKLASRTKLESLKLWNMTNKSYRTQLTPFLTTHLHKNQFHSIHENASDIMKLYSINLNHIIYSSIHTEFFDKFIHAFTITKQHDQFNYICENLFDYTDQAKIALSRFIPTEEISKSFLNQLTFNTTIFGKLRHVHTYIDYRIFQFLLFMADYNMKGRAKIIMKISIIKQLMLFLQQLYVDKLTKHYPYLSQYKSLPLNDVNVLLESYLLNKRFMKKGYIVIENLDIFFFYFYSVIASATIFDNDQFDNLTESQKYSIKKGMIYDMLYYIKSMYNIGQFTKSQQYTILCLFNMYNFIEKDIYLKFFIMLILSKYINYLFANHIVTLEQLKSHNIGFMIDSLSESIQAYVHELSTFEFEKIGLVNRTEINTEIRDEILLVLAKHLKVNVII
jgi:hypothetical protein